MPSLCIFFFNAFSAWSMLLSRTMICKRGSLFQIRGGFLAERPLTVHYAWKTSRALDCASAKTHNAEACPRGATMRNKLALTLSDAQKMLVAARIEAEKNSWNVTIAVVDEAGSLLMLERMDGARPQTAQVATLKARSAAITHRPGKVWEDTVK